MLSMKVAVISFPGLAEKPGAAAFFATGAFFAAVFTAVVFVFFGVCFFVALAICFFSFYPLEIYFCHPRMAGYNARERMPCIGIYD
jgi:hypothetical protein